MGRVSQHPTEQVGSAAESPTLTQKFTSFLMVIVILSMVVASFSEGLGPVQVHSVQVGLQRFNQQGHPPFAEAMGTRLPRN